MFSPVNIRRDDICFAFCLAGSRALRGSSSAEVTHGALWARIGGDMDGGVSDTSASRAKRGEGGARLGGAEMPAGRARLAAGLPGELEKERQSVWSLQPSKSPPRPSTGVLRGGCKASRVPACTPEEDRQGNLLAHTSKTPRRAPRLLSHCRVLKGGMKGTGTATPCCWQPSALSPPTRSCHHADTGRAHPAQHGTLHQLAPQRSLGY